MRQIDLDLTEYTPSFTDCLDGILWKAYEKASLSSIRFNYSKFLDTIIHLRGYEIWEE